MSSDEKLTSVAKGEKESGSGIFRWTGKLDGAAEPQEELRNLTGIGDLVTGASRLGRAHAGGDEPADLSESVLVRAVIPEVECRRLAAARGVRGSTEPQSPCSSRPLAAPPRPSYPQPRRSSGDRPGWRSAQLARSLPSPRGGRGGSGLRPSALWPRRGHRRCGADRTANTQTRISMSPLRLTAVASSKRRPAPEISRPWLPA